jgi:precorrin isomerase
LVRARDVLDTWLEAQRLLRRLTPATADFELVRDIVAKLMDSYTTSAALRGAAEAAADAQLVEQARGVIAEVRARQGLSS